MSQHKIILSTNTFDFSQPLKITAGTNTTVEIIATGSSTQVIGNSGSRIWDTNLLAATSTSGVIAGGEIALPILSSYLPTKLFDALIFCKIDGTTIPIAFSNSPDNTGVYPTSILNSNKNLFWADLYSFGLSNNRGNNTANSDYMFGGLSEQNAKALAYKIRFLEPTTTALSISYSLYFYSYVQNAIKPLSVTTGSITVPIGSTEATYFNGEIGLISYFKGGSADYSEAGYYKVSFAPSDSSYESMLSFYHFGIY